MSFGPEKADANRVKIIKLLELSSSDNDSEALSAIRKANALRKDHDLSWVELFSGSAPQGAMPPVIRYRPPPPPKFLTVKTMFDEIFRRSLSDSLRQKLEEMQYIFDLTDQLSGEEYNLLVNTYNRNCS